MKRRLIAIISRFALVGSLGGQYEGCGNDRARGGHVRHVRQCLYRGVMTRYVRV